jgi:CBS domain-containing protein
MKDVRQKLLKDVMVTEIVSVSPGDTLREALSLMTQNRISAVPVVNGHGRCVGVLSATDLLEVTQELEDEVEGLNKSEGLTHYLLIQQLAESDLGAQTVQEVMTRDVVRAAPTATIAEAAAKMVQHHVHRVIVTDNQQLLLGIVSTTDVLRALAEEE